jgi:hypothetical protein
MMTEFEGQVLADLSVLKSQMQQVMGIGQPGRLTQLEERVERHERSDEGPVHSCRWFGDDGPGCGGLLSPLRKKRK